MNVIMKLITLKQKADIYCRNYYFKILNQKHDTHGHKNSPMAVK